MVDHRCGDPLRRGLCFGVHQGQSALLPTEPGEQLINGSVDLDRATVVAWYANRPASLTELVDRLQQAAVRRCGAGFAPRPLEEVHATLLGLELPVPGGRRDLDGVLRHLAGEFLREPLDVQFGGFPDTDRRPLSAGKTRYERSLVVAGTRFVLIGWPIPPARFSRVGDVRRQAERFGFRHKYHPRPDDLDVDVYLVLGEIAESAQPGMAELGERLRREVLDTPVLVPLRVDALSLVEYVDPRLPAATSVRRSLGSGPPEVT